MRPTAPSGPSARSSRRTGWSPAPWKPGGKPSSPRSPTPSRPWQAAQNALPPLPDRASLAKLAADLPALWHAPTTTARDRKRLLRTLTADRHLAARTRPGQGQDRDPLAHRRRRPDRHRPARTYRDTGPHAHPGHPADPRTRPRHQQPRPGHPRLAQHGYRTGAGRPFDIKAVQWVRHAYQIPTPSPCNSGEISVADAARRLGPAAPASSTTGSRTGSSAARRSPGRRLCIPWTPATEADCQARIATSGHLNPAARRTSPRQRH